jgi:hypothetical protein
LKLNGNNAAALLNEVIPWKRTAGKDYFRAKVVVCLFIFVITASFSAHFLSRYLFAPLLAELTEVSGVVEDFNCRYIWLNRIQRTRLSLKNDDTVYKIAWDKQDCEALTKTIQNNSKISMWIDSNNSVTEIMSDGQIVFTYENWKTAYRGKGMLWAFFAFSELLLMSFVYVKYISP